MLGSDEVACKTWLRVSTSSPTRFIIRFSSVTSTRSVLSAALPCVRGRAGSCSAASGEALDSAAAAGTGSAGCARTGAGAGAGAAAETGAGGGGGGAAETGAGESGAGASAGCGAALCSCGRAGAGAEGAGEGGAGAEGPPALAWAGTCARAGSCSSSRRAIRAASSLSPSASSASMVLRIERRPSSSCKSPVMIDRSAVSLPSRSRPSRFSPEWASFSSRLKPRNPVVPLIVCTERKISPIKPASCGRSSRSVRQRSMRSNPSWLSIRNSLVNSSICPLIHPARMKFPGMAST